MTPTQSRARPVAAHYVTFNTVNPDGSGHGGSVDPQTVLLLFDAENNKVTQFRVGEAARACNSHAALVEALEQAAARIDTLSRRVSDAGKDDLAELGVQWAEQARKLAKEGTQ